MPRRPLIAAAWVRAAGWLVGASLVVLLALSVWLHGRGRTTFDDWFGRQLHDALGPWWKQVLLGTSAPPIAVFGAAVVLVCALYARRWDLAALAVIAPVGATLLCEYVGKPLVARNLGGVGSFPSGHETGVCSTALVLGLALAQLPLARRTQLIWRAGLSLWVVLAGLGLVRAGYHYVTDVVGAIALCTVVVLGTALLVDATAAARTGSQDPALVPQPAVDEPAWLS